MHYHEITPPPSLASYVECYWTLRSTPGCPVPARAILPDGCADIIFNFGPPLISKAEKRIHINTNPAFIVGNMTRAVDSQPTDYYNLVAIRFHPGGLRAFVNVPLTTLTDQVVSLHEFRLFSTWQEQLDEISTFQEKCRLLSRLLLENITPVNTPAIRQAIHIIQGHNGSIRMARLARDIGMSQKQLERKFNDIVGLSPKQTARIIQFRRMVHCLHHRGEESLLQLAADNGYTDHAHFTKAFKEFAGVTPRQFLQKDS